MVCKNIIDFFLKFFFYYIGTESSVNKLSVISQRENVLSAIGSLSRSPSTNLSSEDILKFLEKTFSPMIQQEVHEGLICHMLQQMTGWCSRLTNVNQTLTEFFKVNYFLTKNNNLLIKTERIGTKN